MTQETNDNLILIAGESSSGKSAALRNIKNPEGVVYLNCEAGKKLPFPNRFAKFTITDPMQVTELFDFLSGNNNEMPHPQFGNVVKVHTVVVDSLTFLLDMFESIYIFGSANGQQAWGQFQQYFKNLMQDKVASATVNVIFTAHTLATYNEATMQFDTKVPVKGGLKNNGIEAYFSCVVVAKKVPMKILVNYKSDLLHISPEEEALGFKHVFQTALTKETVGERIRSPMAMFTQQQTYMDNDVQMLLDHVHAYYDES